LIGLEHTCDEYFKGLERPVKILTENLNDYIMDLNILLAKIFGKKLF